MDAVDVSDELCDPVLTEIGLALFHLRRVWAKPDLMKKIREQTARGPGERPIQMSNLMVVHAVAALAPEVEVTVGAVADRLGIDPSTASRLVGHAIDAGLVSRRPSSIDARRANLDLTDSGRRLKQVADRFRRAYLAALLSDWTADERTDFARLLTRFTEAVARSPMDSESIGRIFEVAQADPSTTP